MRKTIYALILFLFMLTVSVYAQPDINFSTTTVLHAQEKVDISTSTFTDFNFSKINIETYNTALKLYQKSLEIKDYNKALLYARICFLKSENIQQRSLSLYYISEIYLKSGNYRKAKIIYRQIISNYSNQKQLVKEIKSILLKL
jgi:tetratricopeptide (TPR) repeat protein